MKSNRVNYRHADERSYSASNYDHAFALLVEDPQGIIRKAFRANSLAKWQKPEHYEEIIQEFALMLHRRYCEKREELVELFNGSFFNYFLVRFLRNQLMSSTSQHADRWQRISAGIEIEENQLIAPEAVDRDSVRSLNATDLDVIYWLLSTKEFTTRFDRDQLGIYRRYLTALTQGLKRITVKAWAEAEKLEYRPTVNTISQVTALMRQKVKHLNSL